MNKNQGFTLIELLVVVLIIGILSSVALLQYQAAVAKSRLSALIPTVRALKDGMELYYLAEGAYPGSSGTYSFDIDVAQGCSSASTTNWISCSNGIYYDRLDYNLLTVAGVNTQVSLAYLMWLDHSDNSGQIRCIAAADDNTANRVCKSMGGQEVSGESYTAVASRLGDITVYKL